MRTEQRESGILTAVAGSSQFGKTSWVVKQVQGAARVIVRDPRMEYAGPLGGENFDSVAQLAARVKQIGPGPGVLCYTGPDAGFEAWARIAYIWGQLWPVVAIADEISDVTNPGKAPPAWGELIRKGKFYGNHIYSLTQRPAECDKTVWGNADVIHCHTMVLPIDADYMARVLGVPAEKIQNLTRYHWIERISGETTVHYGGPG